MVNPIEISVIIPVYNGSASLKELTDRLVATIKTMDLSYEIIFVDDFSKDHSWKTLREIQSSHSHISIIRLAKNFGQHNATLCGLEVAKGETLITMDDDLEHPPEKIPELYQQFKEGSWDIFYACPIKRNKNLFRNVSGSLWGKAAKMTKKGTGKASSFRFIKREIGDALVSHKEPFVYIESVVFWYTENIGSKDIHFERRKHGKSNYSLWQLFKLNHDLGMHYDTHILVMMKNIGITVFFISFALIIYYLFKKVYGNPVPGYTSIIITLLFSTGSLMWGMGYLGLYIGKMFRILNKEPQFMVAEKFPKEKKD